MLYRFLAFSSASCLLLLRLYPSRCFTGGYEDKKSGKKRKGLTFLQGFTGKTQGKTMKSQPQPQNIEKLRGSLS